jgi:Peptidase family M28
MRRAVALMVWYISSSAAAGSEAPDPINPKVTHLVEQVSARRIETYDHALVAFGTRNTNSSRTDAKRGIGAARDWIFSELQGFARDCGGCLTVAQQTFPQAAGPRVPQPIDITNVVATLQGARDPARVYVVSGHYDSMCSDPSDGSCDAPGANDDASGTAAVIEMARVMSAQTFDATIVFLAVAGEEQGLLGSGHFAQQAEQTHMNIDAMFTNDIIGGVITFKDAPDRNTVRVFAEGVPSNETPQQALLRQAIGGENDSPARQLGRFVRETATLYVPAFEVDLIYRRDRYLRGGDHIPFLERGFPAVRFTEPHEDYAHQHQNVRTEDGVFYGDTPDFIDVSYIANVTRVNVAALATLALAPAAPKGVELEVTALTNDTTLSWSAVSAADLAGYEIVWRATSAPYWTDTRFVGKVTRYTIKDLSKDNYFFGVRSVDADGNRSVVVAPVPAR